MLWLVLMLENAALLAKKNPMFRLVLWQALSGNRMFSLFNLSISTVAFLASNWFRASSIIRHVTMIDLHGYCFSLNRLVFAGDLRSLLWSLTFPLGRRLPVYFTMPSHQICANNRLLQFEVVGFAPVPVEPDSAMGIFFFGLTIRNITRQLEGNLGSGKLEGKR